MATLTKTMITGMNGGMVDYEVISLLLLLLLLLLIYMYIHIYIYIYIYIYTSAPSRRRSASSSGSCSRASRADIRCSVVWCAMLWHMYVYYIYIYIYIYICITTRMLCYHIVIVCYIVPRFHRQPHGRRGWHGHVPQRAVPQGPRQSVHDNCSIHSYYYYVYCIYIYIYIDR